MPEPQSQVQMSFGNGPNPAGAPHLLSDGEVASATNIDFSYEPGAAACRRGSVKTWTVDGANPVRKIYRRFTSSYATGPFYVHCGSAIYRGTSGTFIALMTGLTGSKADITSYQGQSFIAAEVGTNAIKDNGTSVTDWIKQSPVGAPVTTYYQGQVDNTNTWAIHEGTAGSTGYLVGAITNSTSHRLTVGLVFSTGSYNYSTEGALGTCDNYGFEFVKFKVSDPSAVTRISLDYSFGASAYAGRWHAELNTSQGGLLQPNDVSIFLESATGTHVTRENWLSALNRARSASGGSPANANVMIMGDIESYTSWVIPRQRFSFVGLDNSSGWSDIRSVQITVEATSQVEFDLSEFGRIGGSNYPLSDTDLGYAYWETWAAISSGTVLGESAPGPVSARTKTRGAKATIVSTGSPTGSHGITHRMFYRQGGFLQEPYAVGSCTITTTAFTDTMPDDTALLLNNQLLSRNILPHASFPNNIVAISEPWYERIFVGHENIINWSLPGMPDCFPTDSVADVSQSGDGVQGFAVWPPGLVIVNRDSVYEMHGNTFEGADGDWKLERTGSRHGNIAPLTILKTPAGIPLFDNDGLYLYVPGQGIDIPLDWVMDKIGDAWRGAGATDPATLKGSRVPAINKSYSDRCCAAWHDNKLYFGAPTGANTYPSTLFVLDFSTKRVWWYTYPWNFVSLVWDDPNNALYAGLSDGYVMQLDSGSCDQSTAAADVVITWSVKTKQWTTPSETVLENLSIEHQGGNAIVNAIFDGTTTQSVGTLTSATKVWTTPKLAGTICNNAAFSFAGIQTKGTQNVLYNIGWDALYQPKRVAYFVTDFTIPNTTGESLWDVHYADIHIVNTGTVLGTVYVDNTAVNTYTYIGPNGGRIIYDNAITGETYGHQSFTVYNAVGTCLFKHWDTRYDARPEPPRVNSWRTDIESLEENRCAAVDCDVNPNGTITGVSFVDNAAITTFTKTGTKRQSFTSAFPSETYGRTVYTTYTGSAFKHYKTWYHLLKEPDRLGVVQVGPVTYPSKQNLATWIVDINPLGTVTGTLSGEGTALATATFTGSTRKTWNVGVDVSLALVPLANTTQLMAVYNAVGAGAVMKHYNTTFDVEPLPFYKTTWMINYTKIGGASQLDMARFWRYDLEADGTATITSIWDVDGTAFSTNTATIVGRQWTDGQGLAFPSGGRGFLFQQRLISDVGLHVWKVTLDVLRTGVKGLSQATIKGAPIGS